MLGALAGGSVGTHFFFLRFCLGAVAFSFLPSGYLPFFSLPPLILLDVVMVVVVVVA